MDTKSYAISFDPGDYITYCEVHDVLAKCGIRMRNGPSVYVNTWWFEADDECIVILKLTVDSRDYELIEVF